MTLRQCCSIVTLMVGMFWWSCAFAAEAPRGFQGGGPLLGQAEPVGAPPMKVRWTYKTSDEGRASVDAPPTIAGDVVYIADADGTLHAVDLKTGQARWRYKSTEGFATSPLVYDGKVFLGDLAGIFHAVGVADGKKVWTVDAEAPIHASANAADGKVLFGTDGAEILCLAAADGKVHWRAKADDRINAAPSIGNGMAFVSGCDAQLRGFDIATGQKKFAVDLGAYAPASPAFVKDRIVTGTDQGRVVCVSADGKRALWTYEDVGGQALVFASPAVADGIVVVGARDRQVHAIDIATGKGVWSFKTRGDVDASPVISSGRVYAASKDKKLYVLDLKTGKPLWEFNASRGIEAGPAIGGGVVVLGDTAGNVFCLEPEGGR